MSSAPEPPSHPQIWKSGIEDYLVENEVAHKEVTPLQNGTSCFVWRLDGYQPPSTSSQNATTHPVVLKCADSTPKYSDVPVAADRLQIEIAALKSRVVAAACQQEPSVHVPAVLQTTKNGFVMTWAGETDLRAAHSTPDSALDFGAIGAGLGKWLACLHRAGVAHGADGWASQNNELWKWYGARGVEPGTLSAALPDEHERARVAALLGTPDSIRTLTPWDFRPMNVLIQDKKSDEASPRVSVVDWELCHWGEPFNDVRMFFAEAMVMEAQHGDRGLLSSFLRAYKLQIGPGVVDETFVRKVAASTGIFMLFLMSAGPQVWDCAGEDVDKLKTTGLEYLRAAGGNDLDFLRSTSLRFLLDT